MQIVVNEQLKDALDGLVDTTFTNSAHQLAKGKVLSWNTNKDNRLDNIATQKTQITEKIQKDNDKLDRLLKTKQSLIDRSKAVKKDCCFGI